MGGVGVIQGEVLQRLLDRFEATISGMFVDAETGVNTRDDVDALSPACAHEGICSST